LVVKVEIVEDGENSCNAGGTAKEGCSSSEKNFSKQRKPSEHHKQQKKIGTESGTFLRGETKKEKKKQRARRERGIEGGEGQKWELAARLHEKRRTAGGGRGGTKAPPKKEEIGRQKGRVCPERRYPQKSRKSPLGECCLRKEEREQTKKSSANQSKS